MAKIKYTKRTDPEKTVNRNKNITCTKCDKNFKELRNLKRHYELVHNPIVTRYYCSICNKSYCRMDVVKNHIKKIHQDIEFNDALIINYYNPRTIAEIPQKWKPPFECSPSSDKTPRFRTIPAKKPYTYEPPRNPFPLKQFAKMNSRRNFTIKQ